MTYNVWNKWGKLKTVMLGTCHPPEFFDYIKEPKIKDPLSRILEETQEDLDNFEHVLKQFGCTVLRPQTEYQDSYEPKWINTKKFSTTKRLSIGNGK